MFVSSSYDITVLALDEEADFEALNCLPALNPPEADTKLHLLIV
ncbi:MAG: hypothetical protein ACK5UE_07765 [Chitinophagales bacterium]